MSEEQADKVGADKAGPAGNEDIGEFSGCVHWGILARDLKKGQFKLL